MLSNSTQYFTGLKDCCYAGARQSAVLLLAALCKPPARCFLRLFNKLIKQTHIMYCLKMWVEFLAFKVFEHLLRLTKQEEVTPYLP